MCHQLQVGADESSHCNALIAVLNQLFTGIGAPVAGWALE